jgi:hypothetical protein
MGGPDMDGENNEYSGIFYFMLIVGCIGLGGMFLVALGGF